MGVVVEEDLDFEEGVVVGELGVGELGVFDGVGWRLCGWLIPHYKDNRGGCIFLWGVK